MNPARQEMSKNKKEHTPSFLLINNFLVCWWDGVKGYPYFFNLVASYGLYFLNDHVIQSNTLIYFMRKRKDRIDKQSFLKRINFWMFPHWDMIVWCLWRENICPSWIWTQISGTVRWRATKWATLAWWVTLILKAVSHFLMNEQESPL